MKEYKTAKEFIKAIRKEIKKYDVIIFDELDNQDRGSKSRYALELSKYIEKHIHNIKRSRNVWNR